MPADPPVLTPEQAALVLAVCLAQLRGVVLRPEELPSGIGDAMLALRRVAGNHPLPGPTVVLLERMANPKWVGQRSK